MGFGKHARRMHLDVFRVLDSFFNTFNPLGLQACLLCLPGFFFFSPFSSRGLENFHLPRSSQPVIGAQCMLNYSLIVHFVRFKLCISVSVCSNYFFKLNVYRLTGSDGAPQNRFPLTTVHLGLWL